MKARITMICHGATADNQMSAFPGDESLSIKAQERTPRLAAALDRADRVLSSPALRARQTATLLDFVPEIEPALADCDYGRWTGAGIEQISLSEPENLAKWMQDFDAVPHGGESLADFISRAVAWLDRSMHQPGHTIAITHASIVRACILHVLAAPSLSFWKVDVEPLSVTQFSSDGRRWTLQMITR